MNRNEELQQWKTIQSVRMYRCLTGDGRCPSSQMSVAVGDTPPGGRLPLNQTWEVNQVRPGKARLQRPQVLFSFAPPLSINQIPCDVSSSATPGFEEWVTRSDYHHQGKIPGAIKCTGYKGLFDCHKDVFAYLGFCPGWVFWRTLSQYNEGSLSGRALCFLASWLQFQGRLAELT